MPNNHEVLLSTLDSTQAEANLLAKSLQGGELVALTGQIGAGKTTFIRFLCQALGAKVAASSPTYVLQHEYLTDSGILIEHWDLYRVTALPSELEEDVPKNTVRLIEWAERFPDVSARATIHLEFTLLSESTRKLKISRNNECSS